MLIRFISFHNFAVLPFSERGVEIDLETDEGVDEDGAREGEGSADDEMEGRGLTSRLGTRTLSMEVGVSGVGVAGDGDAGVFPSADFGSTEMLIE